MTEEDRPKRSWSEIDRMRDGSARRDERRPRGTAAEARARGATDQYLKGLDDALFAKDGKGAGEVNAQAKAVLDGRGSPDFDALCRVYLDAVGTPSDLGLISALLDARDTEIRVAALRGLEAQLESDARPDRALRSQVRTLAEDFDDAIAEAAEDVLAKLPE